MSKKNNNHHYEFSPEFSRGDMTHRGPSDFYQRCEDEIRAAITSGLPFDTDWRGCKHEILSSRIQRESDGSFCCEVSVSDDFDTSGIGREGFAPEPGATPDEIYAEVESALNTAHHEADLDRRDNQVYRGFKILVRERCKRRKPQHWDRRKPRKLSRSNRRLQWVETYILNIGEWWQIDCPPPGDCYRQWGFQDDGWETIPLNVREALEDYARSYRKGSPPQFTCKRWTIKPWEEGEYDDE